MEDNSQVTNIIPDAPADTAEAKENDSTAANEAVTPENKKRADRFSLMSPWLFYLLAVFAFIFLLGRDNEVSFDVLSTRDDKAVVSFV